MFSETNFYNVGNYQSLFLCPLSFEHGMFFCMNLPGLFYSGLLIERYLGPAAIIGCYLMNCVVSAGATTAMHRHLGFHKVNQRGRISNTNGNATLFFASMFSAMAPGYNMYSGSYLKIGFMYVLAFYGILFFT